MSPWVKYQIACAQILMHVCAGSDNVMSSNNKKIASIIGPRIFLLGKRGFQISTASLVCASHKQVN